MDLVTRAGGTLAGEYRVTEPMVMSGPVTGSTVADSVTFSLNYVNPMDGCSGFLQGRRDHRDRGRLVLGASPDQRFLQRSP
jgi:hypothetical protein